MRCLAPISVPNNHVGLKSPYSRYLVPCGKCAACVQRRTLDWFVRLKYEQLNSGHVWFVTLTYDNDHLPMRITDGKLYHDVCKKDVQDYHKRLRKALGPRSEIYKYYLAAEYGGQYERPHYHEIAFNIHPRDLHLIRDCWQNGHVKVDEATDGRLKYVCGYIMTKLISPAGCAPVFNLISQGLGKGYVEKFAGYHDRIDRIHVPLDGVRYHMPRYYKDRLYSAGQRKLYADQIAVEVERKEDEYIAEHGFRSLEEYKTELRAQYAREQREKLKKSKR